MTEAEADYEAHLEQRDVEVDPIEFAPPPRRAPVATPPGFSAPAGGAEQMSPDPVVDDDEMRPRTVDMDIESLEGEAPLAAVDVDTRRAGLRGLRPHRRSSADTLFGAVSPSPTTWPAAGPRPGPEDIDLGEDAGRTATSSDDAKPPRLGVPARACGWSPSASSPSRSVRACSSPSTCCGSGTTSSRWCCRCSSSSASSSACAWCARPRTSAARSSRWRSAPWSHWDPWPCCQSH